MSKLKQYRNIAIVGLLLLAVGYGTGRYLQPAKIQIKKEEVIKEVEVIKKDIRIVEREITRPDGTKEKERITEDKSQESTKKEKDTKESTLIANKKPDWRVNGLAALNNDRNVVYGLQVERRILGPISVGAFGLTDTTVGLSVGLEF